jgi:hypothetical protein
MISLDVKLGEVHVGIIERFDNDKFCFSFDDAWLQLRERPVLDQFFEDRLPRDIPTFGIPPCWFIHLLPQGPLLRMIAREAGFAANVRAVWRDESAQFNFTAAERTILEKHMARVPLGA